MSITVTTTAAPRISVTVNAAPQISVAAQPVGAGGGADQTTVGPGLKLVGAEVRFDIASLPQG